ncbi:MAG: DUF4214 domain-containing protein [Burkholderiales bacterium]|nr:DUF4214 domain-containing protein [Burkholderiales bacterium]
MSIEVGVDHSCAVLGSGRAQCWGTNIAGALGIGFFSTESRLAVDVAGLGQAVARVSAGQYTTCAVTTAGALRCWGDNGSGKLGINATGSSAVPVAVTGMESGVTSVSVGDNHVCAVVGGAAKCWGDNGYGQLGDGTRVDRGAPVQVTGLSSGVLAVAAGRDHSCALLSGGSVKCWGRGDEGQLGSGAFLYNYAPDPPTPPVTVTGLGGVTVVDVTAGDYHTCVRTSAGGAWCWGWNGDGQLGVGSRPTSAEAAPLGVSGLASGVTSLSAGGAHTCAIAGGAAMCWGWNSFGQLGTGGTASANMPMAVTGMGSGMAAVSAGGVHSCALRADGTVHCWGDNAFGKLGDGTQVVTALTPVQAAIDPGMPDAPTIVAITAGDRQATVQLSPAAGNILPILEYRVECTAPGFTPAVGSGDSSPVVVTLPVNGVVFACTASLRNALGMGPPSLPTLVTPIATPDSPRLLQVLPGTGSLAVSFETPADGGSPITGYLATCTSVTYGDSVSAPGASSPITVGGLAGGIAYRCSVAAINAAGTGPASVPWFPVSPDAGGHAPVSPSADVVRFRARSIGSQGSAVMLTLSNTGAASRSFTLATSTGEFSVGGCGLAAPVAGTTSPVITLAGASSCAAELRFTPATAGTRQGTLLVSVPGWLNARTVQLFGHGSPISAGFNFTMRLLESGQVTGFGANEYGQLGNGGTVDARFPVRAGTLAGIVAIAAGDRHAVALRDDGTVWTWGRNDSGQLGYATAEACRPGASQASASLSGSEGAVACSAEPRPVPGLDGVVAISAGLISTTVLRRDGSVWSWGGNRMGALGRSNARVLHAVPGPVSGVGDGVVEIASRGLHTIARKRDGTLLAWGATSLSQGIPDSVLGLPPIQSIAVGFAHNLALAADGTVWSWGWGTLGQLGDGNAVSPIPSHSVPYQLATIPGIVEVAAGYAFSLARRANGTVYAWGNGELGQLGVAAPSICLANLVSGAEAPCAKAPIASPTLAGVVGLYGGGAHTIGLRADGTFVALGANGSGQRGDAGGNFGLEDQRSAYDPGRNTFYYHCDECGEFVAGLPPTPTSIGLRSTTGPITVQPLSGLTFAGAQPVGVLSAQQSVQVTNVSTAAEYFAITSVDTTGDFSASGCGQLLSPGDSCSLSLAFAPAARGLRVGTLALASSLPAQAALSFDLAGYGIAAPGAPTGVTATPGSGQASIAFQAPADDGGSPIETYAVTCSPGAFAATGGQSPLVVPGLSNGTSYSCSVTAASAVGTSAPSASVSVTPFLPATGFQAAPPSLDFGGQSMNTTSPALAVTLTNTGGASITVSSVSASTWFAVTHDCATLAAGASCTASVTFTPAAQGALNGTLTVQTSTGTLLVPLAGTGERSLVTHYYRAILRRAPDAGGASYWAAEAARVQALGLNPNEAWFAMAATFFTSAEYLAFARNDSGFVTDLYNTFFNRAPDAPGLAYWTGQLASGLPREVALSAFLFSAEFVSFSQAIFGSAGVRAEVDTVTDFYRGLLARLPDDGGFAFWLARFRAAQCLGSAAVTAEVESISSLFAGSAEYAARTRNNAQYVGDLYNAFLRRGGDLAGVQFWISEIASGARTRENVRQAFVASPEFQARVAAVVNAGCL